MHQAPGCLEKHQAFRGRRREQAPPPRFLREGQEVRFRIGSEKRKLETSLPGSLPVAGSKITPLAAKDRHDISTEGSFWWAGHDRHRYCQVFTSNTDRDPRRTLLLCSEKPGFGDRGNLRVSYLEAGLSSPVRTSSVPASVSYTHLTLPTKA